MTGARGRGAGRWGGGALWPAVLLALLCAAVAFGVARLATLAALREGEAQARGLLAQTAGALDGQLRRYEALPALLAREDELRAFFARPPTPAAIAAMNAWLEATTALVEASDLYLLAPDGRTLAASNHARPDSFIGQSFTYRPYFTKAAAGGQGRFFALGTTSGVRGYYFASPVTGAGGRVTGVVALKIGVDALEEAWRAAGQKIVVTDPEGIVFLATEPDWLYRGLLPLTPDRLARTAAVRRYADRAPSELASTLTAEGGVRLRRIAGGPEYLEVSLPMPQAGWTVHVLLDTAPLRREVRLVLAATLMAMAVGLSLAWAFRQRRARLDERIAMQAAARAVLEEEVAARTADLTRANAELHRMQDDLVQAGKLAALGRMSAALSHEINQPLAAARNYADSATLLLDRGETARARDNIGQILSLIDRMAAIARHLRSVARKPGEPLAALDLAGVVADALQIAEARLRTAGASVRIDLPPGLARVRGGPVRLQQVLVNLLSNAADAMEGQPPPRLIEITAREEGAQVILAVRDHGPGIAPAIANRIFDPFFTTKTVGSSLGLGLSISYNILQDFGGDLRVSTHPEGGAVLSVVLLRAEAAETGAAA